MLRISFWYAPAAGRSSGGTLQAVRLVLPAELDVLKMSSHDMKEIQNPSTGCFMCGLDNPIGLKMRFRTDGVRVYSKLTLAPEYRGWATLAHGGIISGILDEIMAWSALTLTRRFILTRSMNVRYVRPVHVGSTLQVEGWVEERPDERTALMAAEIRDESDRICATGRGDFALFTRDAFEKLGVLPPDQLDAMAQLLGADES